MVLNEIWRLLDLRQALLRHAEYKMFCADLNEIHLRQTFLAWLNQLAHLNWRHQHKPDRLHHESLRRYLISLLQKHHGWKDK